MWDIGSSIAVGLLFLLDVVVFADLFRAEFSDMRARRVAVERDQVLTVRDGGPTAASPNGVCT